MLIDLTCPAEVFQAVLPTEDIPAVSLTLFNLGDRIIVSVEVTLKLLAGNGAEKERVTYRGRALNGRPHSTFTMNVPCTGGRGVRRADVLVTKVWYNDNAVWRRDLANSIEYTPNELPISKALTDLKFAAGETAVGYPSQQDRLWVCVCGRPNPEGEEICARCRRGKSLVFSMFSREAVETQISQRERQLDITTRNVREDTARMQRIREEEYNRKKDRRGRRIMLAACLAASWIIAAVVLCIGAPALKMWSASRALDGGNAEAAAAALEAIGDFPGAKERLLDARWEIAKQKAAAAMTKAQLREAAELLRALPEKEGSAALAEEMELRLAMLLMSEGRIKEAREAASQVSPENPGRIELENGCLFSEAQTAMNQGDYAAAREILLALGDYPKAAELAAECVYQPALLLIAEGKYDEAIDALSRIPNHPDSRTKTLECHYRKGFAAEEAGELETAATEYLMAVGYEDAAERMENVVLTRAEILFSEGDTEEAQKLFASLPGNARAEERNDECLYLLAKQAKKAKNYSRVLELLDALPEGYGDTSSWDTILAYREAEKAAERGETLEAAGKYEQAGDWYDAKEQAEAQYDLYYGERAQAAREAADTEDYTMAVTILETMELDHLPEKYRDLEKLFETCLREAAVQLFRDGRPYEAERYFRRMKDTKRAEQWLNNACYKIPGTWKDREGNVVAVFLKDNTCEIDGERFTFLVPDSYTVLTAGTGSGEMTVTFRISDLTTRSMTLRDVREGKNRTWELRREEEKPDGDPGEPDGENDDGDESPEDDIFAVKDGE